MANAKISALPSATVPLTGAELVPIVQSGTTDKVTVADLVAAVQSGDVVDALGYTPQDAAAKNQTNGYAGLGADGKVAASQLPSVAVTDTFVVASQSAMLALSATVGDVAVRTDTSTTYILTATPASTLANWTQLLAPTNSVTSVNGYQGTVVLAKSDIGLGNVENKSSATIRSEITSSNVTTALGYVPENAASKGTNNGYASLDSTGKVPLAQLPSQASTGATYVVSSQAGMLALSSAVRGDVAVRTDISQTFILTATPASTLANWQQLLFPTSSVTSVAGRTGAVTLSAGDISGLAASATTNTTIADNISSGTLSPLRLPAVIDSTARVGVKKNNAFIAARRNINFQQGNNVTLDVVDSPTTETVQVTINASGGGSSLTLTTTGTSGVATYASGTLNIPNYTYTLPTASTSVLGGVKVDGSSITISGGVISATGGSSLTLTTTGTSGVATYSAGTLNIPNYTYTLPTATTSVLGGVKVDGTTVTISSGVISAAQYTLPTATTSVLGGVKVDGTSITISGGVISAASSGITSAQAVGRALVFGG